MRTALIPYVNQYVLVKGWITDWEDDAKTKTRRVYVSNAIIKKADKNLTFENQELISKEEHINFFAPYEHIGETACEKYMCVAIAGFIYKYTRKDGSIDYAVKQIPQSALHEVLDSVLERASNACEKGLWRADTLATFLKLKQELKELDMHLESAGDLLPTFYKTYSQYKKELSGLTEVLDIGIKRINCICSNRAMRRKLKIKHNFARPVKHLFGYGENVM